MISLRSYIKHSKECFIRYPNTLKWVKKILGCASFITHFSLFGNPEETFLLVFDILQKDLVWKFIELYCIVF